MTAFDPYHRWLGIPTKDQPPHHYRLLAIDLFESDPEVISQAADQRMGHLRKIQAGPHAALSQQLLNEVAAARRCLLNAKDRAAYDEQLRATLAAQAASMPPLPPVGMPWMPGAGPLAPGSGPQHPAAMLPIGTPLPASHPSRLAVPVGQQMFPAVAPQPEEEVFDELAALASENDTAYAGERPGRRSKDRRGRRQTVGGRGLFSLLLLGAGVATLALVLWLRAGGDRLPPLAGKDTADATGSAHPAAGSPNADKASASHAKGPAEHHAARVKSPAGQSAAVATDGAAAAAPQPHVPPATPPASSAKSPPVAGKSPAVPPAASPAPVGPNPSGPGTNPGMSEGFRPLFNGVDLTGWKQHPQEPALWRVEKGVLIASGSVTTHLYSERDDFHNVHVRANMRVRRDTNAGIFVRSSFGPKTPSPLPSGYEARVFSNKGTFAAASSGLIKCYSSPPGGSGEFPHPTPIMLPDDWFTLEFRAVDYEFTSLINGQVICRGTDSRRYADRGHIAVQFRGPNGGSPGLVEFASIEVKELP